MSIIDDIKRDRETGMPDLGGWSWVGGRDNLSLATRSGGRRYVMDFVRKGMRGAQPRFQTDGLMRKAIDHLTTYQVGEGKARGQKEADEDNTVYRMDISGVDHPDARRIARVPEMEARILADAEIRKAADDLAAEVEQLTHRLRSYEADGCDCERSNREYLGHVTPPLARSEYALAAYREATNDPS